MVLGLMRFLCGGSVMVVVGGEGKRRVKQEESKRNKIFKREKERRE